MARGLQRKGAAVRIEFMHSCVVVGMRSSRAQRDKGAHVHVYRDERASSEVACPEPSLCVCDMLQRRYVCHCEGPLTQRCVGVHARCEVVERAGPRLRS